MAVHQKKILNLLRPTKLPLALVPTKVQELPSLNREVLPSLYVKRDDETGCILSGNKIRKLEFLLSEAKSLGATHILTTGGWASNHARATAVAARMLGMDCTLVLRKTEQTKTDGNLFLDYIVGAEVVMCTPEEYSDSPGWPKLLEQEAARLAADQPDCKPYIIPEGGSNALGCWGYISAFDELLDGHGGLPYTHIVVAVGSGGTLAGLLLARSMSGLTTRVKICGVAVSGTTDYWKGRIADLISQFNRRFGTNIDVGSYEIWDQYVGPGYGLTYEEEVKTIKRVARIEAMMLDPVYTGKAFHGLLTEVAKGNFTSDDQVLFIHTGGIFGLLAQKEDFGDIEK